MPEFEAALDKLAPGEISAEPAQTTHGFHVLRLDRKIDGATLPFSMVRERIADYLAETRARHAIAGAIGQLAQQAKIEGVVLAVEGTTRTGARHDAWRNFAHWETRIASRGSCRTSATPHGARAPFGPRRLKARGWATTPSPPSKAFPPAQDEDWVSLLSALNRAADPGAACLRRMIDWLMERDGERTP